MSEIKSFGNNSVATDNMVDRAWSTISIKSVDQEQRIIEGVASTPNVDRMGDIVDPLGAKFTLPMPLLFQHRSSEPVGHVVAAKASKDGITFKAKFAKIEEPGNLKDRLDEAWQSIKAGLVRAVSIGFRSLEHSILDDGGIRFTEWEWMELSLVTIPANAEATIQTIKSIDEGLRAATGRDETDVKSGESVPAESSSAPRSGKSVNLKRKERDMKTISEQIAALEAKRAANEGRMNEIMAKAMEEGRSTDEAEREEFDELEGEVETIDGDLKRFRALEKSNKAAAKPVDAVQTAEQASDVRGGRAVSITSPKPKPGIRFARVAKCIGMAKGNLGDAARIAESRYGDDQGIVGVLKAAVEAGTTSDATWAGPLVGDETSVFADFVEFLRPMTILGRFGANGIPALRQVPFRTALISQTTGGAGYWTGEAAGKGLTRFSFSRTHLEPLKVANIAVVTDEVLRDSSPSAEMLIRDGLAGALRERMDIDFVDPTKAAVTGISPASITNGVTPIQTSGVDADAVREDIRQIVAAFIAADNPPTSGVWIMSANTALALSLMQNPLGQSEFPGIGMSGGNFFGMPVIVSEHVPTSGSPPGWIVILANASDVYLADDGGISIDMSREASLQMDDTPTMHAGGIGSPQDSVAASVVSLWQTNTVGFRAERTLNWLKRRTTAVQYLTSVSWGTPVQT